MKHYTINLTVSTPDEVNLDTFINKMMSTIEDNDWTCGGGFGEVDEEGNPIQQDE